MSNLQVIYEELLEQLSGIKEYGHYAAALCPKHEDHTASLMVYKDGWFRCLACGYKGRLADLQKELAGWEPPVLSEAPKPTIHTLPTDPYELEQLCKDAHQLLLGYRYPLQSYLYQRKVEGRIVPQKLGYWNNWYSIPCYDENEMFMGVVMRASPHLQQETGARFNIPKGQPAIFYVPDWGMALSNDYLCVVFGMFDALALCELGIPSGTSTSGKDSTNAEMLEWCRKTILIIPDEGEEDTARKLLTKLGWRGKVLDIDYPPNCKDPADMLEQGYGVELKQKIEEARNG